MNKDYLLRITEENYRIGGRYHIIKTGKLPSRILFHGINDSKWEKVFEQILDTFRWKKTDYIIDEIHSSKGEVDRHALVYLSCNITVHKTYCATTILFDENSDKEVLREIKRLLYNIKPEEKSSHSMGVIISIGNGLDIQTFEYSLPEQSLIKYLNSDTQAFHRSIVKQLKAKDGSGLYLMHGKPGTGKTSFIKDVLSKTSKEALFISPFFTENLTSPNLISLLMEYPDSILVIEDAESVLMERKADNSSAVSNLLNLTDGFLADFLNLKIICTFNTELNNIDDALLRQGRLKGMHEFTEIQPERARKIADVLGRELNPQAPMTLAEICVTEGGGSGHTPRKIGFSSEFNVESPFKN